MNERLAAILAQDIDKYPADLAREFPQIANRIADLWGTEEVDRYLGGLIVSNRESRQGFPLGVMSELLALHALHYAYRQRDPASEHGAWAYEREMSREKVDLFGTALPLRGGDITPQVMFRAVEAGDTRGALGLVRAGMDVNVRRSDHWTPLMVALFNAREETAQMLITLGADVRAKANRGYQPIHWAAHNGHTKVMRTLIEKGADVNAATDHGWTPLFQAATRGYAEISELLAQHGAAINAADYQGLTALHQACRHAHPAIVKFLLANGADPNAVARDGTTPMALAKKGGNADLVGLLRTAGAQE